MEYDNLLRFTDNTGLAVIGTSDVEAVRGPARFERLKIFQRIFVFIYLCGVYLCRTVY